MGHFGLEHKTKAFFIIYKRLPFHARVNYMLCMLSEKGMTMKYKRSDLFYFQKIRTFAKF